MQRFLILLVLALLFGACTGVEADTSSPVVARIGEQSISEQELDDWIKQALFERETSESASQLHEVRQRELDNMIAERLLEAEAARRELPVGELLETEIPARAEIITASAVRAFYDDNADRMGGESFEAMRPRIRNFLEQNAQRSAQLAFVDELRVRENVEVLIATPRAEISEVGPSRGPADARVTLVEFSDYQCPFCQRAEATVAALLEAYPKDLRFVYRHFPLESIHPEAHGAARAANCAGEQGHFWEYHERLFTLGADLKRAGLEASARAAGLQLQEFRACLDAPESAARVDDDLREGQRLGVKSTPTFFINGIRVEGALDVAAFRNLIERELRAAGGAS